MQIKDGYTLAILISCKQDEILLGKLWGNSSGNPPRKLGLTTEKPLRVRSSKVCRRF